MRTVILLCLITQVLFTQCSNDSPNSNRFSTDESITFSEESDDIGRGFAQQIRSIVTTMDEEEFYRCTSQQQIEELALESGVYKLNKSMYNSSFTIDGVLRRIESLTFGQREMLNKILQCKQKSKSKDEFLQSLLDLKGETMRSLSEIEQKRILNVLSILYYGCKVLDELMNEGYFSRSNNSVYFPIKRTKSGVEGETPGDIQSWCASSISVVWLAAVAEPTPFGELVATGATVVWAGVLLYEFIVKCTEHSSKLTRDECIDLYSDHCVSGPCDVCLQYCITQGVKDSRCTYK